MEVGNCYLDGNADAVEFCPYESYHHVLAASTYTLQEGDQPSRSGSISLFNVDVEKGSFELFHRVETTGIFDIKWSPAGGGNAGPLLAQADADGCLRVHSLEGCSDGPAATEGFLQEVAGEKISTSMCLCLDWNPSSTSVALGLSDGSVSTVLVTESKLRTSQQWKAHDFEVWATSFDIHQPYLVYTGADDCKFSCWDTRENQTHPVFQNSKVHTMGVCCITKTPNDPYSVFTGSYDEKLRVWDIRAIGKPVSETSIGLGGGVWRIKHHPSVPGLVLTACMHNGFAIVKVAKGEARVLETYSKHGSLAYGADWQRGKAFENGDMKNNLVATCSFYDKLLRVWMPESKIVEY